MTSNPMTVTEFLTDVKGIISEIPLFQNVILVGELSNFKAHSSGHFYFSLKDDTARINVVMFRSHAQSVRFNPKDGDKVIIQGRFDVYTQSGQMQIYAVSMQLDGLGDLYIQYEALRKELAEKGFFDSEHKKERPMFPMRIGVICGAGSAAYADITRTLSSRWPLAKQVDYFSLVQGDGAIEQLVSKITEADNSDLDVIILARGGGSIEDLWAFNTLPVIMAVYNCNTPIVTGIGHESDTTLSDYVADYRAATPTGAAHDITPDYREVSASIKKIDRTNILNVSQRMVSFSQQLNFIKNKSYYKDYRTLFNFRWMDLDRIKFSLNQQYHRFEKESQGLDYNLEAMRSNLVRLVEKRTFSLHQITSSIHADLDHRFTYFKKDFQRQEDLLLTSGLHSVTLKKRAFSDILKSLNHLSPLNVMIRGYSVSSVGEHVVKTIDDVTLDDEMQTRLVDGILISRIIGKEPKND